MDLALPTNGLSVDVEDWFNTMRDEPKTSDWDSIPSHVEKNLRRFFLSLGP